MQHIADTIAVHWARIADAQPWLPVGIIAGPWVALATAMWGDAFVLAFGVLTVAMVWDWLLGGQVAARRGWYLTRMGVLDPEERHDRGAFSFGAATDGFAGKLNLAITLLIFGALEALLMLHLGNPHLRAADAVLPLVDVNTEGYQAISGAAVVAAAALQEFRSIERNRQILGGRHLPIFSAAIDRLDRAVSRMVPNGEGRELEGVETLETWYQRARVLELGTVDLPDLGESETKPRTEP